MLTDASWCERVVRRARSMVINHLGLDLLLAEAMKRKNIASPSSFLNRSHSRLHRLSHSRAFLRNT